MMRLPTPRYPEPQSERARQVVEWAEVAFYVFCLVLTAVALAMGVVMHGPEVLRWR